MKSDDARPLSLPDIGRLRAALAVRDEASVTRAADRLGLTQPAVSRLIAALEADLGFPVFVRERRRLAVSEQGRKLLAEAEAAIGALRRVSALGHELRRGQHGLVRLAAVSALAHGVLPRALAAFARELPDVTVEVVEVERDRQVQDLLSGRFDLGLVALPAGASGLRVDILADTNAVCLLPADHPLAARPVLRPVDLKDERFIAHREGKLMRQRVDDAFGRFGCTRRVTLVVDSTPLAASLVAARLGVAITHPLPAPSLPSNVVSRPFEPRLSFGYAALTPAAEQPRPLTQALMQHVRDALASEHQPPVTREGRLAAGTAAARRRAGLRLR
jgi:DNA-binding transcriptional LysR family regulator